MNQWDLPSLVRRLEPPQGPVDVVLDTDTFNEVDDQFALSYLLAWRERLQVQALYALSPPRQQKTWPGGPWGIPRTSLYTWSPLVR